MSNSNTTQNPFLWPGLPQVSIPRDREYVIAEEIPSHVLMSRCKDTWELYGFCRLTFDRAATRAWILENHYECSLTGIGPVYEQFVNDILAWAEDRAEAIAERHRAEH